MVLRVVLAAIVLTLAGAASGQETPAAKAGSWRIVFISDREGGLNQVYSMESDGSDVRRITQDAEYKVDPAISPDGKRLAYVTKRDGSHEICLTDPDGKHETQLTTKQKGGHCSPCWYPDGKSLVYIACDATGRHRIVKAVASVPPKLTPFKLEPVKDFADSDQAFPAISPDGKRLAFVNGTNTNDTTFEIYVADDTGKTTRLTDNAAFDSGPSWTPDGKRLAFTSNRDGNDDVYVMDADGKNVTRLTDDPGTDTGAAFSPDGKRIVFVSTRTGNVEIFIMNADGSDPKNLTNGQAKNVCPRVGPARAQ